MFRKYRLPAEWEEQACVQLTWPDPSTEWYALDDVLGCYTRIAASILRFEPLLIVCRSIDECRQDLLRKKAELGLGLDVDAIRFYEIPVNDTWARDHGAISLYGEDGEKRVLDFVFNGWGLKYGSDLDNQINRRLYAAGAFAADVKYQDMRPFVLEGGSIESDGAGTLMTTTECLCSLNRNDYLTRDQIEECLVESFGLRRVLWLNHGSIKGDDTDSHVDNLARFCSPDTIAYTRCEDPADENAPALAAMEEELRSFRTLDGRPYKLVPLPLPDAIYLDDYRLPGSYSNFLILNGAVLVPGACTPKDEVARERLQQVFPDREVIVIDCRPLLSGFGGLHCITMNYPKDWIR